MGKTDFLIIISLVVGILAGLWTVGAASAGLIIFAGFMAWSTFFASGGKLSGLKTTLITNLSGVMWAFIILELSKLFGPIIGQLPGLGVAVVIGATAMCLQSKFSLLAFIPGTFIGCATYFGTNFDLKGTIIALIFGAVLGYISETISIKLSKSEEAAKENVPESI